jgi:hypothetical protein
MEVSGLKHLPAEARERATAKNANKFEKTKVEKCGSKLWTEVHELSALLREGKYTFDELNLDDVDVRLKWAGLFHRSKRAKGTFMMRLKVRARASVTAQACAGERLATPVCPLPREIRNPRISSSRVLSPHVDGPFSETAAYIVR